MAKPISFAKVSISAMEDPMDPKNNNFSFVIPYNEKPTTKLYIVVTYVEFSMMQRIDSKNITLLSAPNYLPVEKYIYDSKNKMLKLQVPFINNKNLSGTLIAGNIYTDDLSAKTGAAKTNTAIKVNDLSQLGPAVSESSGSAKPTTVSIPGKTIFQRYPMVFIIIFIAILLGVFVYKRRGSIMPRM